MKRARAPYREPVGGYLCECGQPRGAHQTTKPGSPSYEGGCRGYVEAPGQREAEADPHEAHKRLGVVACFGVCAPCAWRKVDAMCIEGAETHIGRAGRRLRTAYEDAPGYEREP